MCIASAAMCFVGCVNDDNEPYPSLKTDVVIAETNASGILSKIKFDNGNSYDIASQKISFNVADTLIRCVASYTLNENSLKIYSIANIYSNPPVPLAKFLEEGKYTEETLPRDPVNVVSMWKSGGYINMQLGVLTSGYASYSHAYAFCEDAEGEYSLLHLRPSTDTESYTEIVFLSMPIPEGVDSLTFSVATYEGTYTRTF